MLLDDEAQRPRGLTVLRSFAFRLTCSSEVALLPVLLEGHDERDVLARAPDSPLQESDGTLLNEESNMEGRNPHAIRLIRTNCSDPRLEAGFNEWYDRVHVPEVLSSGMVSQVIRYRTADPGDSGPGYLAIHELRWDDLERVARAVARTRARLTEQTGFPEGLEIVRVESWRRTGPEFVTPRAGRAPAAGIFVIESRCTDPQREREFNAWYDDVHIPDLLGTGLFSAGYRFEGVAAGRIIGPGVPDRPDEAVAGQGGADPTTYLAIYETGGDPMAAVAEFARVHRPRLKAAARLSEIIDVTWRGVYRTVLSVAGR
jgi:hypothetical protein